MNVEENNAVGAVVIGRNEGDRLKVCLRSILVQSQQVVYVDSGSEDGSADFARSLGIEVVELDLSRSFSAGRARNEGFAALRKHYPYIDLVQFVDGDCELSDGWIAAAREFMKSNPEYAAVAGRLKERYPEKSVYNMLCDIEWAGDSGDTRSCGGIFVARVACFDAVAGFNPAMIAGEEPELCYRFRSRGWKIHALDVQMATHDADMHRFVQWWRRTVRGGYAYANAYYLHGREAGGGYHGRETLRIWVWSFVVPLVVFSCALIVDPIFLVLLLVYPLQVARQFFASRKRLAETRRSFMYALFSVLEKLPQFIGQLVFLRKRLLAEKPEIMEYK